MSNVSKDSLGDRQKAYEKAADTVLPKRMPIIMRLDGKAFHTYTRPLKEPFHEGMHKCMLGTMEALCNEVQNAKVAYTQSDEITILLNNWQELNTESWFGNRQGKMIGDGAAIASTAFNDYAATHMPANVRRKRARFDCRVFVVPHDDVCNNFIWRQQDATRNSIQMLAQSQFSHNELHGVNNKQAQYKLLTERNINWNDLDVWKKRGSTWKKDGINVNPPIFQENRFYIEECLMSNKQLEDEAFVEHVKQYGI